MHQCKAHRASAPLQDPLHSCKLLRLGQQAIWALDQVLRYCARSRAAHQEQVSHLCRRHSQISAANGPAAPPEAGVLRAMRVSRSVCFMGEFDATELAGGLVPAAESCETVKRDGVCEDLPAAVDVAGVWLGE